MTIPTGEIDAIVLRLVDHGERNRIVTLLSPEYGRFAAMARGARGKSRRFGGHLDLFHRGRAELQASRRGTMPTLQGFSATELLEPIRRALPRFTAASFFVELVLLTTAEHDASVEQFDLLAEALRLLAEAQRDLRPDLILGFQLRWFDVLGELPELDATVLQDARLPHLDEAGLAVARALREGVAIADLDEPTFRAVGAVTRALRNRIGGRELSSAGLMAAVLTDAWPRPG